MLFKKCFYFLVSGGFAVQFVACNSTGDDNPDDLPGEDDHVNWPSRVVHKDY